MARTDALTDNLVLEWTALDDLTMLHLDHGTACGAWTVRAIATPP